MFWQFLFLHLEFGEMDRVAKFSRKKLIEEIMREGKVLGLHPGAVEAIAIKVADTTTEWIHSQIEYNEKDLNIKIIKELKKYHHDLAYIYENRGKII